MTVDISIYYESTVVEDVIVVGVFENSRSPLIRELKTTL